MLENSSYEESLKLETFERFSRGRGLMLWRKLWCERNGKVSETQNFLTGTKNKGTVLVTISQKVLVRTQNLCKQGNVIH